MHDSIIYPSRLVGWLDDWLFTDAQVTTQSGFPEARTSHVLFEETHYNEDFQSFKVLWYVDTHWNTSQALLVVISGMAYWATVIVWMCH
jgi:hypothetical protein